MEWIYLSPHLDDIALSCGGLVWEQVKSGDRVSIWTICAGEPPPGPLSAYAQNIHNRWQISCETVSVRKAEDLHSCQIMGAKPRYFSIPDAIYRISSTDSSPMYTSEAELFGNLRQEETELVEALNLELQNALPEDSQLVCPMAFGGHVDHRLVKSAAQGLTQRMWYYADYPYIGQIDMSNIKVNSKLLPKVFPISEAGLEVWVASVAAHASQISTFWSDQTQVRDAIHSYWEPFKGIRLWHAN
jgi:LmbE family N-acetylglucosaminyl deacetylase